MPREGADRQAACSAQHPSELAERPRRIRKEEESEATEDGVERLVGERQILGVADERLRVGEPMGRDGGTQLVDHSRRQVDPHDAARLGDAPCGRQQRRTGAGRDVEDAIANAELGALDQQGAEAPEHRRADRVVARARRREHRGDGFLVVPRLPRGHASIVWRRVDGRREAPSAGRNDACRI